MGDQSIFCKQFVIGSYIPIVVRLIPFIPPFIPQHLFKSPRVVSVPCQEIGRSVNGESLLDMGHNNVVVSAFGA